MKKVIAAVLFIGMAGQANADLFVPGVDGTFNYGGFTWATGFANSDGSVTTDGSVAPTVTGGFGAPGDHALVGEVQIFGSDILAQGGVTGLSSINTTIGAVGGTIEVTWNYLSGDSQAASADPFIWFDGVDEQSITNGVIGGSQSGVFSMHVDALSSFSLGIMSDNKFGGGLYAANVGLSGFSFTSDLGGMSPVPVPPAFLLFGTALAGLSFFRKKKAAV